MLTKEEYVKTVVRMCNTYNPDSKKELCGECYTSVPVRMMTEEMAAIEELKKLKECNYRNPNSDADWKVYDAINMAIITLEKQILKEAGLIGNAFDDMPMAWVCPTCEEIVVPHSHHCTCGQALDWGEEENDATV